MPKNIWLMTKFDCVLEKKGEGMCKDIEWNGQEWFGREKQKQLVKK